MIEFEFGDDVEGWRSTVTVPEPRQWWKRIMLRVAAWLWMKANR